VGVSGGYDLLAGSWHPPGGSGLVLTLFAMALVINLSLLVALAQKPVADDQGVPSPRTTDPARPTRTVRTG